jgi:hypothetical protein
MPEALYKPHGASHFQRISLEEAQKLEAEGKAYRPAAHQPGVYYGTAMVSEKLDAVVEKELESEPEKEQVYETRMMEASRPPQTSRRHRYRKTPKSNDE